MQTLLFICSKLPSGIDQTVTAYQLFPTSNVLIYSRFLNCIILNYIRCHLWNITSRRNACTIQAVPLTFLSSLICNIQYILYITNVTAFVENDDWKDKWLNLEFIWAFNRHRIVLHMYLMSFFRNRNSILIMDNHYLNTVWSKIFRIDCIKMML